MLEQLDTTLAELLRVDCAAVGDEQLATAVAELNRRLATRLDALKARFTGELDRRRLWAVSGAKTAAAWLATECRIPSPSAKRQTKRAKLVAELPGVQAALDAGAITADHVDRFVRARNRRTAEALARDEAELVGWARSKQWNEFNRLVEYWCQEADPEGPRPRAENRRVSLSQTLGGDWALDGWLDPISGAIVHGELARLEQHLFDADWAAATAQLGRDPLPTELARTSSQRRADALVEMATRSATMPKDGRRPRPLITIAVGGTTFERMCEILGGTVVRPTEAAPLLAGAAIERIVFGEGGRTITVSKQRTFTGALRRAIAIRDRNCFHPYCTEPAFRCQGDHILPWSHGGPSTLDNGRLACAFHNRARSGRSPPV